MRSELTCRRPLAYSLSATSPDPRMRGLHERIARLHGLQTSHGVGELRSVTALAESIRDAFVAMPDFPIRD
jgi:hypothetical protein